MGGGGGGYDVFEVPYTTAKIIFTFCSQFHNCIPYTDKKSLHSILSLMLQLSFLKIAFTFRFFCKRYFSRIYDRQEENSIITAIQSVKPISLMKMRSEKINIYLDTVYHTTAHYTAQLLFAICKHNNRFLLSELKKVCGSMKTLSAIQKMLVSPADFSTRPEGRALWEESLVLSKIHS